ncbi:MAG TPA: protein phosphatase 2C domain-containing protein, partial [Anaerolineae bacterium]
MLYDATQINVKKENPGNWRVVGASVMGTSHQEMGTPCQDAHAYRVASTGELIVAIADGAGSASRSAEGAALVVQFAVDWLTCACQQGSLNDAEVWQEVMRQCFTEAAQALAGLAKT